MKIALIAYEFYPRLGGISQHLTNMCKSSQNKNHQLFIFNQDYSEKSNTFKVLDKKENYQLKDLFIFFKKKKLIKILILSIWKILNDKKIPYSHRLKLIIYLLVKPSLLIRTIKSINNIYPYFKKINFKIIVGGSSGSSSLLLTFILSRLFNIKVISIAYGNEFLIRNIFSLKTFILHNLDKIVVIAKYSKYIIKRMHNLNESKLKIIPVGLILKDYQITYSKLQLREKNNVSKDAFILLSVGRHVKRKNFDLVIRSIKKIKDTNSRLKINYYLIGDGPETVNLKRLTEKLNLKKEVKFLGTIDAKRRNEYYKLSDVFAMPSIKKKNDIEGFGIVFLEANYFKIPVIGAASGGVPEAIIDGKTGLLIKPNDLNDLT
ncbi:MAG: glycosyltransferase family 4 protein, partial [Promethearchaeota archaeon]